ncbi:hypothetical protein [Luteimonas sp. FCS-9]|uniref:hypothetical protein n=1 Tax=Luteimonas sp. FCS-9 TaxID=1547516 RepID=UPI0018CD9398|nr:hypothetical protein [Luteimonas sp. FCS-9]
MRAAIAIGLAVLLAGLALAAYDRHVLDRRLRIAQDDLQAWSALVEDHRRRTLQFPIRETQAWSGFLPASRPADFAFFYPGADGYPLTAVGASGGRFAGCTLTLDENGRHARDGCPPVGRAR